MNSRANEEHADRLPSPQATATVDNPLCGDIVTIDLAVEAGLVTDIGYVVRGCLLCQASAAALSVQAIGKDAAAFGAAVQSLAAMLRDGAPPPGGEWGDLAAFAPVAAHKSRHRCVTLPFDAAREALADFEG